MCGICGEWNPSGVRETTLARMNETLSHRGPDDHGRAVRGEIGLAMRRLSIIDPAGGHQPMSNERGTQWIVFNGEIYNHREIRADLVGRHRFRTASDTEAILHLYEEVGDRVVERLRGMFAFALWDGERRRLLLARDRFGQKPLFYAWEGSRFLFGSEIKSLLAGLERRPELDIESLDDYLTLRFVPSPGTMLSGIRKLPPGHLLVLEASETPTAEVRPYWSLRFAPKRRIREEEAIEETTRLLRDAVRSHLLSDVPVGAFLSGGMDSSLVVAYMAEEMGAGIPTFAIGVAEQDYNELPFAAEVARHWKTDHHEETVSPDLIELLPRIIHHLDEPSDPIAACMYHAAALAGRHVKVVLSGDGGDEVFAGFDRYYGFNRVRHYASLPAPLRKWLFGPLLRRLPDSAGYKNFTQKARWLHDLSFHTGGRRYAEATAFFRFGAEGKEGLFTPAAVRRLAGRDATDCIVAAFESAEAADDLDRMLYADVQTRLPEHSLMLTDRMTMSQGLEGRSPFLDHHLAEFVATLPSNMKIRGSRTKYILRRLAAPHLPESILRRPKQGFMFPLGYWMRGPLVPVLRHLLADSVLVRDGIFRSSAIATMLEEHLSNRADHHVRLWMILNVEMWYRMVLLGERVNVLGDRLREQVRPLSSV